MTDRDKAHEFLLTHGRLVERRRLLGDAEGVRHAVLAHRNADGGFGHAMEPDVRSPHSQPLATDTALGVLLEVGLGDVDLAPTCDWLQTLGDPAVPILLPTIIGYPKAGHWGDGPYEPDVNPTATLAGHLHALGMRHPWLDAATEWCWATLEKEPPAEAHAIAAALEFLEHAPDRERADRLARVMVEALPRASWFRSDPDSPEYGVTPLGIAPRPDHPWAHLFDDLDGHLDRLERDQEADGGWPITWDAPGATSITEWRGVVTLDALRTLEAFGRLAP